MQRISSLLANYFQNCSPERKVWNRPTLTELILLFDTKGKGKTVDCLLPPEREVAREAVEVRLKLEKDLSEKQECDLGK